MKMGGDNDISHPRVSYACVGEVAGRQTAWPGADRGQIVEVSVYYETHMATSYLSLEQREDMKGSETQIKDGEYDPNLRGFVTTKPS